MDQLLSSKIGTLFALFFLSLIFGCLPYLLLSLGSNSPNQSQLREKVIKVLNCFGGGVFLGALLLNLMIEGSEEFDKYKETVGLDNEYPFFNVFIACGFFLVALLEYFVHSNLISLGEMSEPHSHVVHSCSSSHETRPLIAETHSNDFNNVTGSKTGYGSIGRHQATCDDSIMRDSCDSNVDVGNTNNSSGDSKHINVVSQQSSVLEEESTVTFHGRSARQTCTQSDHHARRASPIRAFILLFALSFHTVFDGLAIGLQESILSLWEMFAAISIHKCIMAFCLGLELFTKFSHAPRKAVLWIIVFSFSTPIGISVGISLTSGNISVAARYLSSGILQGLASGTFMYVTFLEILNVAWQTSHDSRSLLYIIATFVGFTCMAGVRILDP